jgi:hypothetical protein
MSDEFDVEGINPDELDDAGKAIYAKLHTNFRNAWLKKNDTSAKQMKQLEIQAQKMQTELNEAHTALAAYYDWYQTVGKDLTAAEQRREMDRLDIEKPNDMMREIKSLRDDLQRLAQTYESKIQNIDTTSGQTRSMLDYALRLNELRYKHRDKDIDLTKVTQVMKDRGINDPDLAYQLAYDDEIRSALVEKEVSQRVEDERKKIEAERDIVDASEATSFYQPPSEPKSYAEASQALLSKIRSGD